MNHNVSSGTIYRQYDATGPGDVPNEQIQANISAYRPPNLVGPFLADPVRVTRWASHLPILAPGQIREEDVKRAPGAFPKLTAFSVSSAYYFAQGHSLAVNLPFEDLGNADPGWQLGTTAAFQLIAVMARAFEARVVSAVNSQSNVSSTWVVGSAWNAAANPGNPVAAINTILNEVEDRTGHRPNRLVFGRTAWRGFWASSYSRTALNETPTTENTPRLFRVDTVAISQAYTDVPEGQTGIPVPLIDDMVIAVVGAPGNEAYATRWACTPYWSPVPEASAPGQYLAYLHDPRHDTKSRLLEVSDWSDITVVDRRLAAVIVGVNSAQAGGI